ncbi:MAG: MFS transporter [Pseudomonadota bacterium]
MSKLTHRPVIGWALYDIANSAFALCVVTTFYPIFFRSAWSSGASPADITSRLSFGVAASSLVVAFIAPVLGAIADAGGTRKKFLIGFTVLAAASTLGLYFVAAGQWSVALSLYAMALIGFYSANTFYDSLLVNVTEASQFERVSALGYGVGYLGSALLLAFNIWMVSNPLQFGFADTSAAVRMAFAIVALWWLVFSVPLMLFVEEERAPRQQWRAAVRQAYASLWSTFRDIRRYRNVAVFLLAYWLYIDGVHTLILMATDFGARLNFASNDLVLAILITNFVGAPATIAFGYLGKRIGAQRAIYIGISVYIGISLWGLMLREVWQFYAMAIGIGFVQGGVQSMSRALYARLVPAEKASEFFGFYSMLGKFAAILGPFMIGVLAQYSDDPRVNIFALLPLFIGGLIVLSRVRVPAGERGGT